jgi:isopentenyl diphosphate isomerase/L-lactate dehydrogenase-like FMN-dependent dehydrogenase
MHRDDAFEPLFSTGLIPTIRFLRSRSPQSFSAVVLRSRFLQSISTESISTESIGRDLATPFSASQIHEFNSYCV